MDVSSADSRAKSTKIFDCDVHCSPKEGLASLRPYMTRAWQERFQAFGDLKTDSRRHPLRYPNPTGSVNRLDAKTPTGGEAGSDPAYMVEHFMNPWRIDRALLVPTHWINAWTDPRIAAAYVAAFNDHFVNEWLPVDERFGLAILVSPHDATRAAEEIRRHAQTKRVCAVFLPLINILLGNRYFHPIYEAAQECGLPIVLHPAGAEGSYQGAPQHAGGVATSYAERNVAQGGIAMANLSSLLFEGTFETFPNLKIVFTEWGYTWLPPHLWKCDLQWTRLRMDMPWLKRLPSEYVWENVRFTTQPVEEPPNPQHLLQLHEMMRSDKILLFATDYPHWDNDDPYKVLNRLPEQTRKAIYWENPMEIFGARF